MKKSLTTLSLILGTFTYASAQLNTTINIGQNATQGQVNGTALTSLIVMISDLMKMLTPLAVTAAVLAFFWFLIEFIWKGKSDPAKQKTDMAGMGYSILALFVMVSIWGLVGFMGSIVGIGQGGSVPIPQVPVLR